MTKFPLIAPPLRERLRRLLAQGLPWPMLAEADAEGLLFDDDLGLREAGIGLMVPKLTPTVALRLLDWMGTPAAPSGAVQAMLLVLKHVPTHGEWEGISKLVEERVLELITADEPDIRYQALYVAEARGVKGGPYGDMVCGRLLDPDKEVRGLAAQAMTRVGTGAHTQMLRAVLGRARDADERFHLLAALAALGEKGLCEEVLQCLRRGHLRFAAIQLLGGLGDAGAPAIPELKKIARRWWSDSFERVAAAGSLHQLGDREGETLLRGFLKHRREEVRGFALQLAVKLGFSDALALIKEMLERGDDKAASIIPELLAGRDEPAAKEALQIALAHPLAEVREAALNVTQPTKNPK